MKLFSKISNGIKLFNKSANDGSLFRKVNNTARKIDHSVMRVGEFIKPVANSFGVGGTVNPLIDKGVKKIHLMRNSLEKAVNMPVNQLTNNYA